MKKQATTVRSRILRALLYIEEHLDEQLSLEDVARVAAYSPYHFHSCFQAMVGETLAAYQRRLRLERAAQFLAYTSRPVLELALQAGYGSQEAFSRAFRNRFCVSPAQYRRTGAHTLLQVGGISMNTERNLMKKLGLTVDVKHIDDIPVAFVRHNGPYEECRPAWDALVEWAKTKDLLAGNPTEFGISHDDPSVTEPEHIRYDACISLPEGWSGETGSAQVKVKAIEGGRYACVVVKGPYSLLAEAYAAIYGEWLPSSGEDLREHPCVEVYLNCPLETAPEELLTEIRVPLAG